MLTSLPSLQTKAGLVANSSLPCLHTHGVVVVYPRHDRSHKLQKQYQVLVHPHPLHTLHQLLHHTRVFARVDTRHRDIQVRMRLHGHRLVGMVRGDVFEDLGRRKRVEGGGITVEEQAWGLVVFVISDGKVVRAGGQDVRRG